MPICPRSETTSELPCNGSARLAKFTVVHWHSPSPSGFCTNQISRLNGDAPLHLSSPCRNPSRQAGLFLFSVLSGRGSSNGFHVAFSPMTALTPQVSESMSVAEYVCSGAGEIAIRFVQGPFGPTVRQTWAKTPMITQSPAALRGEGLIPVV